MMLDQREDAEQLAAVKAKYGFDKPIATQYVYYLNDVSPISFHSTQPTDYTFLENKAYQYTSIGTIGETTLVLKYPYLSHTCDRHPDKKGHIYLANDIFNYLKSHSYLKD